MRKSLLSEKFGKLTVVSYDGVKNKNSYWMCQCECGNEVSHSHSNLVGGKVICCGWECEAVYSLVGQKFGKLTVTERAFMKNKTSYWKCLCECGTEVVVKRSHLGKHHVGSCGCLLHRKGKAHPNWDGCGEISGSIFSRIQTHAKRRKIEFDVAIDYLWDLFQEQKGKCALSAVDLVLPKHQLIDCTASLDRIDSSIGYVEGNVQWVHKDVNFMKQQFEQHYFIEMCFRITQNKMPCLSA